MLRTRVGLSIYRAYIDSDGFLSSIKVPHTPIRHWSLIKGMGGGGYKTGKSGV